MADSEINIIFPNSPLTTGYLILIRTYAIAKCDERISQTFVTLKQNIVFCFFFPKCYRSPIFCLPIGALFLQRRANKAISFPARSEVKNTNEKKRTQ